jgi:HSP20 family protein
MTTNKQEMNKSSDIPVRSGGLSSLRDELNALLDRFGGADWLYPGRSPTSWNRDPFDNLQWPTGWDDEGDFGRADLSETDGNYELRIDLPGMNKDDITVDLSDGILTVAGERSDEREDERKGYHLSERSYGSVRRSFRVPESVNVEEIQAEFKDGVLTLTMPKTEEVRKNARRIDVE